MTDLNAPLGQSGGKSAGTAKPPRAGKHGPAKRRGFVPVAALVFAVVTGLNAWAFVTRDTLPEMAEIALATPAPAEQPGAVTDVAAAPQTAGQANQPDGVNVVYGLPEGAGDDDEATPPPIAEGRISEGGPKIIVVRDPTVAEIGQSLQVAHLPNDDALEETEWGGLPVRTPDGRRPMDIYARPWSSAGGKRIAIVIGGLGLSQTGTLRAIKELPPEITLAFAPQGHSLNRWMREARSQGHELLVQVPMEPYDYPRIDPGPQTLTVAAGEETNLANLRWALGQISNYTGIVNYQGGRFATDADAIGPVLREVSERGLLFMNDGTAGGAGLASLARAYDTPYVTGHVVLDATQDPSAIQERLKELEKIAEANGYAIGSGSAFEVTVDTVAAWANGAKKRGFEIVGVSALAR
jgi:polysaccharide deacetylase 2 family uncharacterized protein YibQ